MPTVNSISYWDLWPVCMDLAYNLQFQPLIHDSGTLLQTHIYSPYNRRDGEIQCSTSHGVLLQAKYLLSDDEIGPNISKVNYNGRIVNTWTVVMI